MAQKISKVSVHWITLVVHDAFARFCAFNFVVLSIYVIESLRELCIETKCGDRIRGSLAYKAVEVENIYHPTKLSEEETEESREKENQNGKMNDQRTDEIKNE